MTGPDLLRRALRRGSSGRTTRVLPAARLGGPMPWMIAIMVALTVLAAAGSIALANFADQARAGLEGGVTVQIVNADRAARDAQADAAAAALTKEAGVMEVRRVPETEIATLVEPWLGDAGTSDAIVLPALIDLRLEGSADGARLDSLREKLGRVAPSARLDAQAGWLQPLFGAIAALRWLAAALMILLTLASAAAVWLAARNALDANRETIEIVHHLGGNDAQIAGIFQRSVLVDALLGGALGLALGLAAIALVGGRFAALQSGLTRGGTLAPADWALVAMVPLVTALVAVVTARRTVMARLGAML